MADLTSGAVRDQRATLVLAKKESTYGSDPTAAGSDAVRTDSALIVPERQILTADDMVRSSGSKLASQVVSAAASISMETLLMGSGTAGTAPEVGPLWQALGMDETIVASTSVTYAPVSTGYSSVAIYGYADGGLSKILGGLGESLEVDFAPAALVRPKWSVKGLYTAEATASNPTPTFDGSSGIKAVSLSASIGGDTYRVRSMKLGIKNTLAALADANKAGGLAGYHMANPQGREITLDMEVLAPPYATKDVESLLDTEITVTWSTGVVAWTVKGTLEQATRAFADGLTVYQLHLKGVNAGSGDDEFSVVYTG